MKNKFIISLALLLCLAKASVQSSLFQNFVNEVQPQFTTALGELNKLVNLALQTDESQPLNANSFSRPEIRSAIRDTHTPLTAALSIAQRHVADYDNRIASAAAEIGGLEQQIHNHRASLESLNQQRAQLEGTVASLQASINHNQQLINDNRAQLENQQNRLRRVRKRRKWWGVVTVVLPPVGIAGVLLSNADVDRIKNNIRHIESNLEGFRNSKQQAENQLHSVNTQIQSTDQAIRQTQSLLQQKQQSLQTLQAERNLIIELGVKLKNSTTFLSEFQGKVDVMEVSTRVAVFMDPLLNSLEDLLIFLSRNIDSNVAMLSTTRGLQQLRQLIQQSLV